MNPSPLQAAGYQGGPRYKMCRLRRLTLIASFILATSCEVLRTCVITWCGFNLKNSSEKCSLKQMQLISRSIARTNQIARDLAQKIVKNQPRWHAVVIALEGELGAGKTTFTKAFARALGVKNHITSPTFVILKNYKLKIINYNLLVHVDAYRLKNYRDLLPLGVKEAITDPGNIVVIEWSERVRRILPKKYIKVHIDHIDSKTRRINIL